MHEVVDKTKKDLVTYFGCEDCDKMKEYVGNKLTRLDNGGLKLTQDMVVHSFKDKSILVTRNGAHPQHLAQF